MALQYLAWELAIVEEKARVASRKIEKRLIRDASNPFELPIQEFIDHFRLNKELVMELADAVRPKLISKKLYGLSVECQVLTALLFYATGTYQRGTGANSLVSVSQPSVSRIVHQVTAAINESLLRKWIKFPMTAAHRDAAKTLFSEKAHPFNGAIGAIDCTHVLIAAPRTHEEAYKNHHRVHSINVQAICDPKLKVLDICARWPGARHDSFIWQQSSARAAMKYLYDLGERDTFLLGDSGYPLEPWLLTPLPHYPLGTKQYAYTLDHCRNRNPVERLFGVVKSVFRAICDQRVLLYDPQTVGEIVVTVFILHNMRIAAGLQNTDFPDDVGDSGSGPVADLDPLPDDQRVIRNLGELTQRRVIHGKYRHQRCACGGRPNFQCVASH